MSLESILSITPSRLGDKQVQEVKDVFAEKGFEECVGYLWCNVFNDEEKKDAERAVIAHEVSSDYYKVFVEEFKVKIHFFQVCNHRYFIKKAFQKLEKYCKKMKKEEVEQHDLTKLTFAQAVGYTCRWVHNIDNVAWREALQHHYDNEPHHPEYFKGQQMPEKYLEESVIDMVASRWERQLGGKEDVSNYELVNFDPKFLLRYNKDDLELVKRFIKEIQDDSDVTASQEEK